MTELKVCLKECQTRTRLRMISSVIPMAANAELKRASRSSLATRDGIGTIRSEPHWGATKAISFLP